MTIESDFSLEHSEVKRAKPLGITYVDVGYGLSRNSGLFEVAELPPLPYTGPSKWREIANLTEYGSKYTIGFGNSSPGPGGFNFLNDEWYAVISVYLADIKVYKGTLLSASFPSNQKGVEFRVGLREMAPVTSRIQAYYEADLGLRRELSRNTPRINDDHELVWIKTNTKANGVVIGCGLGLLIRINSKNSVNLSAGIITGRRPGFEEEESSPAPTILLNLSYRKVFP